VTHPKLREFAADPAHAAILLDFDGTLAPIVERPEDAAIVDGGREVLASLVPRFLVVAVVSGRPRHTLEELIGVDGVRYEGLYGLPTVIPVADGLRAEVEEATKTIRGAWVEPKSVTLAVHYRHADDPVAARARLTPVLDAIATREGYDLLEGKMVFELAPAGESRKGGAVTRIVRETGARAALYAGDDLPDLEAFAALDELSAEGLRTLKVAVGGVETQNALLAGADSAVADPASLIRMLLDLGSAEGSKIG
jgi:trehalose 6-phosphate phosphatase